MATSLAEVPGLNLADMQCGGRFCRASFVSENGKPPNITEFFGASPFIDSGFTINEPDGSVRVYFTQPGQSLSELAVKHKRSSLGISIPDSVMPKTFRTQAIETWGEA